MDDLVTTIKIILLLMSLRVILRLKRWRIKRKRLWVKPRLLRRGRRGAYLNLCRELQSEDLQSFQNFARVVPNQFQQLLQMVTPIIQRQNTDFRDAISPGERLMITLRFLATGNNLMFPLRSVKLIPETCRAIYQVLKERHLKVYPPPHCGAQFFNYKHFNSIVMIALVDSNYRVLYVDVGCNGRVSDGGVFRGSTLQESLEQRTANIPQPTPLPGTDMSMPFLVAADEAFPLKSYLMKPFARRGGLSREQRVFNYRLSRARRIVENTFGVFANRFRFFLSTINLDPNVVEVIVLASCALHNYLRDECFNAYLCELTDQDGQETWRQDPPLQQAALPRSTNASSEAKQNRERLMEYFNSEAGAVSWQWDRL
uniref:DDE Tnp4 domain-containing protein n=1 Tax=Sinocyclocheilus grahami TaxID=75366 RepID=A0A672QIC8_SINGR